MEIATGMFVFFFAIAVSTVAMMIGVGGPIFFSPAFMLMGLTPVEAFGTALATQMFGFLSGVSGYLREKQIDLRYGKILLMTSIPAAIMGALIAGNVDTSILKILFALVMPISAIMILKQKAIVSEIKAVEKEKVNYYLGMALSGVGGWAVGLLSTGLGALIVPYLFAHCKLDLRKTVGTSILVVFLTVVAAALTHLSENHVNVDFLLYTAPAVLIGGQIGVRFSGMIGREKLKIIMVCIYMLVFFIMSAEIVGII